MILALAGVILGVVFASRIRYLTAYSLAWIAFRAGPLRNPLLWLSQVVDIPDTDADRYPDEAD